MGLRWPAAWTGPRTACAAVNERCVSRSFSAQSANCVVSPPTHAAREDALIRSGGCMALGMNEFTDQGLANLAHPARDAATRFESGGVSTERDASLLQVGRVRAPLVLTSLGRGHL